MRVRTQKSIGNQSLTIDRIWGSCSESSFTEYGSSSSIFKFGEVRKMTDEVVPNFHERRRRGEVFFNSMSSIHKTVLEPSGPGPLMQLKSPINCSGVNRYQQLRYNNSIMGNRLNSFVGVDTDGLPVAPSLVSGSELSSLLTEVSTSVQSQRGKSSNNLFESLAEVDRSLAIIPDLCKSGRSLISRAASSRRLQTAANLYLLYRYGLRPIVNDISGVMEGIQKKVELLRETTRASQTIYRSNSVPQTVSGNINEQYVLLYEESISARAMSLDEYMTSTAFNVGFSPKGLLTLPWELVPYSFVVDWFVNVGDVIGSLVPAFGFSSLGSCISTTRSRVVTLQSTGYSDGTSWSVVSGPSGFARVIEIEKIRTPGLLAPGLVVKSDFRLSNATRALDAISLLVQKMRFPRK